ncbi:MBL fold metallo-hydrolase [Tatumella saanichensis]|uniref:MBL fold metallo-hydrolase n=1 Tax=Tatumella saanichensis TaxID=480813 RepID=UPI0004A32F6C|nr:MBL fold metallo-hydrolase [Tatumella saanichensis]
MSETLRFTLGQCEIIKIPEVEIPLPTQKLYPDQQGEGYLPDTVQLSVHSWVVRTPQQTLIIDTSNGNGRDRPHSPFFNQLNTRWLEHLMAAGIDPDQIDLVLMTHLHGDHIGWNTHRVDGVWQPLFKHARYICSAAGLAAWEQDPSRQTLMEDSLHPVIAAGLLDTIDLTQQNTFADCLTYLPTPGHTQDHASVILHSDGAWGIFSGDLMHSTLQVSQPELASCFCENAEQAEQQRQRMMAWAADHQALWFSSHFAESSAGYMSRQNGHYHWQYA